MNLEEEFVKVHSVLGGLPKPDKVENFIAFFFRWSKTFINYETGDVEFKDIEHKKKSILNDKENDLTEINFPFKISKVNYSLQSTIESEFDFKKNLLKISEDEAEYLNKNYFDVRAEKTFTIASQKLNAFYLKYKDLHKYDLADKLEQLYEFLFTGEHKDFDLFINEPKIEYSGINILILKDNLRNRWQTIKSDLYEKIIVLNPDFLKPYVNTVDVSSLGSDQYLEKYIEKHRISDFCDFEKKLRDQKFLDENNKWIYDSKKSLVEFFLYCQDVTNLLKTAYSNKNDNRFLRKFLETRYDFETGDQGKQSKFKDIKGYKGKFYFLQ